MRQLLSATLLVVLSLFLNGCGVGYLLSQGMSQFKLYSKKIPIEKALKDPSIPESIKTKLNFSQEVKRFAEESLGLDKTKNYDYYLPFDKPYLTYVVTAADKFSMTQHLWKYPIIGALPYKGFFSAEDARNEATKLDGKGFDTYIRGVSAYSTLGWLNDPLTTPQLENNSNASLAELLIHELTHSTVYFSGEGDFNETLAEFVAGKGTKIFILKTYGARKPKLAILYEWEVSHKDSQVWDAFVQEAVDRLKLFYESKKEDPNLLELKTNEYKKLKELFVSKYLPRIKNRNGYNETLKHEWNNAFLLSNLTYSTNPELFEKLYEKVDKKMPLFIERIKELKKQSSSKPPFEALREIVDNKK